MLPNDNMDGLFRATVEATEEAVINAMVAATDMTGDRGHRVKALPHTELREVLRRYGRLEEAGKD
jgi:D-aminopeptidase